MARFILAIVHSVGLHTQWRLLNLNDEISFEVWQRKRAEMRIHSMRVIAGNLARFLVYRRHSRDSRSRCFDNYPSSVRRIGNVKRKNAQRSVAVISVWIFPALPASSETR